MIGNSATIFGRHTEETGGIPAESELSHGTDNDTELTRIDASLVRTPLAPVAVTFRRRTALLTSLEQHMIGREIDCFRADFGSPVFHFHASVAPRCHAAPLQVHLATKNPDFERERCSYLGFRIRHY